jgi:hypothetical protein
MDINDLESGVKAMIELSGYVEGKEVVFEAALIR